MKLKWIRLLLLSTAVVLLTACGGGGLSEADIEATVEAKVKAALTAVPTTAPLPTYTPYPVPTPEVVVKEVIVEKIVVVTATPTPTPTPTATPVPTATPTSSISMTFSPGASLVIDFQFGGNTYEAISTGGVNRTIIKTGSTLKIIVDSTNCFTPAGDTSNDCPRDIRRSQIRSDQTFSIGQDLRYNFTVQKEFNHGDAGQGGYINFFEIKPVPGGGVSNTCPTAVLYVNPASNKLTVIQSLGNHCNGGAQQDVMQDIGTMKQGKNDFQVVTKQTPGGDGYIKVFQNGVLIYQRNGKSSYDHSRPIQFWVGGYICCGKINDLLSNGEPDHTFLFENLSSAVETAGQSYTPTWKLAPLAN